MRTCLEGLFGEDLHAKRVLSLALATLGVIHAASLSVYAIGQAVALARGAQGKHGVKQVDRLLSNAGIAVWKLLALWVPYVLGQRTIQARVELADERSRVARESGTAGAGGPIR